MHLHEGSLWPGCIGSKFRTAIVIDKFKASRNPVTLISDELYPRTERRFLQVLGENQGEGIGVIPIDSIFSPVRKVAYNVESTQVGQMTNFDKLVIDIRTDGSITPGEAISSAGKTLNELLGLFAEVGEGIGLELGDVVTAESSSPDLELPIEALDLSERPRNCLRRAQIQTVGELVTQTPDELLNITNFGQKSLDEVTAKLDELGLSLRTSDDEEVSA